MKKKSVTILSACLVFNLAFAQVSKSKQIYPSMPNLGEMNANDATNVAYKSMIRFDMHNVIPADQEKMNEDRLGYINSTNPEYAAQRNAYEQSIQNYISAHQNQSGPTVQMVITCPIVVHCVYGSAAQNISLNQVMSQLQVMNEDFGRTNADANSHWSAAANTTIQFCLAQVDPLGNATTGLETRQYGTASTSWSTNDNVKHYANGGLNIWDPTRYLNIWVCNLTGGLLGYGEFPTGSTTTTFGVAIDYTCFGSNYTSYGTFSGIAAPFDRGRTVTHEFSHCFNLYHIWGDDGGACTGSDLCADTPNQADATSGCFTYPHTDGCATTNPGIMYENYMDYSDDVCLNLFTANQKTRMLAVLNTAPYNALQTSTACGAPVTVSNDAGIFAIGTPNGNICGTSFIPSVTLKNFGSNNLTSCTINYRVDATANQTYSWSGTLTPGSTAIVALPSVTTTAATHTFTCYTSMPNNVADGLATNDQTTSTFTCVAGGGSLPFFEGFEGTTFVPAGWALNNPDGGVTWARTTACAKTGVASAKMDNWGYQGGNGQIDEMTAPPLNLSTVTSPVLTFQVANTYWTVPQTMSDTLEVLVSSNCGATWTSVYKKWGTALSTAPPLSSNTVGFVPSASQWRLETVSLLPYQSSTTLYVKFRNISDYEDNTYIDDINIMNSTGIENSELGSLINLFPNPSTGVFNLNIALESQKDLNVKVINPLGQTVQQFGELKSNGGMFTLDMSTEPNGVYFVEITAGSQTTVKRIMINR